MTAPAGRKAAAAAGLLAAACVAWSAIPLGRTGGIGVILLAAAALCAALGTLRLLVNAPAQDTGYLNPVARIGRAVADAARGASWAEGAVVAVLVLEALHGSRPGHTGMLGAALLAYLLAVHLAESNASLAVLRPQAPLLAAGLGLLALAVGAAMFPAATGTTAELMVVLVAVSAVLVGCLAVVPSGSPPAVHRPGPGPGRLR